MKKNLKKTFKIEPSGTAEDTYIVYRKVYLKAVPHWQKVAIVKVTYGRSYRFEALIFLSSDEVQYLRKQLQKIACIGEKQTFISML